MTAIEDPFDNLDFLEDELLANVEAEENKHVTEINVINEPNRNSLNFSDAIVNSTLAELKSSKETSLIHDQDLDSSDDEAAKNFLERKYNEYGASVKSVLKLKNDEQINNKISREVNTAINQNIQTKRGSSTRLRMESAPLEQVGIYTDPVFGMRIIHPLISSTVLVERMSGRCPVTISSMAQHLNHGDLSKDWCFAGAIVRKGPVKTSKKGNQFSIWNISDLKGDCKSITLFLFAGAFKDLWKTAERMVVAVLNPSVMDKKPDNISLSVNNSQQFLILGQSKDFGTCKSRKRNGEPCTNFVNLYECEYCVFHVKEAYKKMTGRSELQSNTSGPGLNDLRNKVLGKNEVFYGGKSFTAVAAKKNVKQSVKDQSRLMSLSDYHTGSSNSSNMTTLQQRNGHQSVGPTSRIAGSIEIDTKQRQRDLDRLKILTKCDTTPEEDLGIRKSTLSTQVDQVVRSQSSSTPRLSKTDFSIDLSTSFLSPNNSRVQLSKLKAAAILKNKPIVKSNPNFIKYRGTVEGRKRALEQIDKTDESEIKKAKITEAADKFRAERIKTIMDAKSAHTDLIEAHQNAEQEKYFNKLEKKEAMEEKMLSTYKVDCKAVICLQCKYTALSAADHCKKDGHALKVIDAQKRFFECEDCKNRTISLNRIPKKSCKNCQGSRWKRTGMIRDRKSERIGVQLSIRGDEEAFIGSLRSNGHLNLCVPDTES